MSNCLSRACEPARACTRAFAGLRAVHTHSPAHLPTPSRADTAYFLNGSNHADGVPPPFISSHLAFSGGDGSFGSFFSTTDDWITNFAAPLDALRAQIAPSTRLIMNEFIPASSRAPVSAGHSRPPACADPRFRAFVPMRTP